VWIYDGEDWLFDRQHTFVWDGWNIVLERIDHAYLPPCILEYYWGDDLSGTEQGAGGVGGLLAVSLNGAFCVPYYDCNGNIMGYVDEFGSIAARYVYDPFGNSLTSGGIGSSFNGYDFIDYLNFGFSTKYHDREVGLVAYQLRSYSPRLGRWLNRDPIEEEGGVNLYGFVDNGAIYKFDVFGLWKPTRESYGHKRLVYKKSRYYKSLKGLAKKVGLDIATISVWGRIETSPVASETSSSPVSATTAESKYCYISVPNIWIEADLLRGGTWSESIINLGGTIGSFWGNTLGRFGYHFQYAKTTDELFERVKKSGRDLYGFTVYGHGYVDMKTKKPTEFFGGPDSTKGSKSQLDLISLVKAKGYRIAQANMMQCYSHATIMINGQQTNFRDKWHEVAVLPFGYIGVNAFGIDLR
jgi:RHS repeat-associated protein